MHLAGQMRFKLCCSKHAHTMPPNQRSKSRFLNIEPISKWGVKALGILKKKSIEKSEKEQLNWLKDKEYFLKEMHQIMEIVKKISIILKNNGLSKKNRIKCLSLMKKCKGGKMKQFRKYMISYFNESIRYISRYKEILLCSSDIIESTFGRYKNEINKNPMIGITDLSLIIPAFTANLSCSEINKAIDSCSVETLNKWAKENLCESLYVKRDAFFKTHSGTKMNLNNH